MASTLDSKPDTGRSLLANLWRNWLLKRKLNRARYQSQVKFKLTREGVHFAAVLLFIFFGAVVREINLLILLAGTMIGLLLLQWRFNIRTLIGLSLTRRLPRSLAVNESVNIKLSVNNPKHWLSSWVVLVEDPLQKLLPNSLRLKESAKSVVDEVRPRQSQSCMYQLEFKERGKYRIGPTTLSTKFPIGLGRGWRTIDNSKEIVVHPRRGELSKTVKRLFRLEREGHAATSPSAGLHEGEFFGLRPWQTGDSRRWIHWRTTARQGSLSVRQFERQQQFHACVLLDLYQDPTNKKVNDAVELAISFIATLAAEHARSGADKLSTAIAAKDTCSIMNIQSPVLVEALLDELAICSTSQQPDLASALRSLAIPLLSNPLLTVISTRENQIERLKKDMNRPVDQRLLSRTSIRWINVSAGELEPYFRWIPNK